MNTRRAGLLAALAICVVLGCTPKQVIPLPSPSGTTLIPPPFASLMVSTFEQNRALHDASELAVAKCMKQRGFNYEVLPYAPTAQPIERLGDVEYAERYGYGINYHERPPEDPNQAGKATADQQAFADALLGKSEPGKKLPSDITVKTSTGTSTISGDACAYIGIGEVYGDIAQWFELRLKVDEMVQETYQRLQADSEFAGVDSGWKECMAASGYGKVSRGEHTKKLREAVKSGALTEDKAKEQERAIAVTDAKCVRSSGAADTINKLIRKYENLVAQDNEGVIIRFGELQRAALEKIKAP